MSEGIWAWLSRFAMRRWRRRLGSSITDGFDRSLSLQLDRLHEALRVLGESDANR